MQAVKTYFITGATGAIGSALVPFLLTDAKVQVTLLIRASSAEQLSARLETLFNFWGIGPKDKALRQRVTGLQGDVTQPHFGLSESEYERLVNSCTHIVHAAGNVRMNLPIDAARHSALDSAKHIVTLSRACLDNGSLRKVEFVSTVGVGGRLSYVREDWLTVPRVFHNTYEQAKAEAEDYLREQIERHQLPVTVHRPSMVVGDTDTGKIIHFQIFYYLCEFLSGRQTFGLMPALSHARLDTIPVDYVAKAIRWSSCQPGTAGKILHLCSGPDQAMELPWLIETLREILIAHGEQLPHLHLVPLGLFQAALPLVKGFTAKKTRKALNNLFVFLDYASDQQQFFNSRTNKILSAAGISIPPPDDYLAKLLTVYLSEKGR